jgi:hypothetical protein
MAPLSVEDGRRAAPAAGFVLGGSGRLPERNFGCFRSRCFFCDAIDVEYLLQIQGAVVEMICNLINSVTAMGWQFPGTSGPGAVVYERNRARDAGKPRCLGGG